VLRQDDREHVLQATPLSKRPLDEVFHLARITWGHRAEFAAVLSLGGSSRLSVANVKKGLIAKTTACLGSVVPVHTVLRAGFSANELGRVACVLPGFYFLRQHNLNFITSDSAP